MKYIPIEEQKHILLYILKSVDKYCRMNNLRYSLGGGTLLGAVRHKGFIPWDDDIDIMMPRPDYDKLINGFSNYDKDLTCVSYEVDKNYIYPFAKIYHNKTILEEIEMGKNFGIFIDVFPIDGFPVDEKERSAFLRSLYFWRMLLFIKHIKFNISLKRILYKIILFFIPNSFIQSRLQKMIKKYPFSTTSYSGAVSGIYQEKECYSHDLFENYVTELYFEGYLFMSIKDYDTYLLQHYGNYMQLPPIEQQKIHHTNAAYWLTK